MEIDKSEITDKIDSTEGKNCRDQHGKIYSYAFDGNVFCLTSYKCLRQRRYEGDKKCVSVPVCGMRDNYGK